MLEVVNRQRKIKFDVKLFCEFSLKAFEITSEVKGKTATIVFVSDRKMRSLNKTFRGKNSTTDVLSFPFEALEFKTDKDNLGDIIISVERAQKQAAENNLDFEEEIKQLILHGILHLCGFDHETDAGEMNRRELELRDKLGI